MKNSDMPAMPATIEMSVQAWQQATGVGANIDRVSHYPGLTKREHFAGMAMQGILSNSCDAAWEMTLRDIKVMSYEMADKMLEES